MYIVHSLHGLAWFRHFIVTSTSQQAGEWEEKLTLDLQLCRYIHVTQSISYMYQPATNVRPWTLTKIVNYISSSLVSRPTHVFQCMPEKSGRPGRFGDVHEIRCDLRHGCVSPPTRPHNECGHGFTMWLTAWVCGWRFATEHQTASNYITRLLRHFWFFLQTWEGLGMRLHFFLVMVRLMFIISFVWQDLPCVH